MRGLPNYKFVMAWLLLKSTTSTFSRLGPEDAGHSRKNKNTEFRLQL